MKRHWVLALLFAAQILNLLDRQIVNVLAQDIKTELAISDAQLGLLTGTAFGLFYSLLAIPLGRLADRVNRVKLMAVALALWSGFTALCGVATNFAHLFVARVGVGVGEAGSVPASTSLVADLYPENRRTSAISILQIGAPVGSFLGLLIGGYVGSRWGWRMAFLVAGIPGLIVAAVMLLTAHDPRPPTGRKHGTSVAATARMLARKPALVWIVCAQICATFLVYASGAWLPAFFIRVHGMTTGEIGTAAAIAVGLGGGAGTLSAGLVCDRLRRRMRDPESFVLVVALALSVPTLLVTVLATRLDVALGAMFLFDLCAFAWLGPTIALIQTQATPDSRGLAIALTMSISNALSLAGGLPLVGVVSDVFSRAYGPGGLRYALALTISVAGSLAALAYWRAGRQIRR